MKVLLADDDRVLTTLLSSRLRARGVEIVAHDAMQALMTAMRSPPDAIVPGGAAWSRTEGQSWHLLPGVQNFWAVAFAGPDAGWPVGTEGRILKVEF